MATSWIQVRFGIRTDMASYYNSYLVKRLDQRKPYENLTSVKKIILIK